MKGGEKKFKNNFLYKKKKKKGHQPTKMKTIFYCSCLASFKPKRLSILYFFSLWKSCTIDIIAIVCTIISHFVNLGRVHNLPDRLRQ